tara:strand:+ start:259 stop:1074 length:816 start_codon:yes stop_codon:yes gene_type:complete
MKLGVCYNVFDGEELLESSITCIREYVDFVVVVGQEVSNFGERYDDLLPELLRLKNQGLIDYIHKFIPVEIDGKHRGIVNEALKRNIGKDICLKAGCTHNITMDCDEMYISKEFEKAKNKVEELDVDTSYITYDNYYKKPYFRRVEQKNLPYTTFIVKCDERKYSKGISAVNVDPTRSIDCKKYYIFNRDEIKMHHYSYMRKSEESLRRKLNNTSFRIHSEMDDKRSEIVDRYMNYEEGQKALLPSEYGFLAFDIERVEDKLKLDVEKFIL